MYWRWREDSRWAPNSRSWEGRHAENGNQTGPERDLLRARRSFPRTAAAGDIPPDGVPAAEVHDLGAGTGHRDGVRAAAGERPEDGAGIRAHLRSELAGGFAPRDPQPRQALQ